MAENKSDLLKSSGFNGSNFIRIYVDGVDLTAVDDVTDIARDIVSSNPGSDYLFYRVSATAEQSQYILCLCDTLDYSSGSFSAEGVTLYTFNVGATFSARWTGNTSNVNFSYDGVSGTIQDKHSYLRYTVTITPSVQHLSNFSYSARDSEFFYSSITDFPLVVRSQEVNLLACIAFILAVFGCSLWFAAIFRNVLRR